MPEFKNIKNIKPLTKGHRGLIYTGIYKNKKVTIKTKNPSSKAIGRIQNEVFWLKKLNKKSIGPKLLFSNKNYFVYQFIPGVFFPEFVQKSKKPEIKKALKDLFMQCHTMDKLKVDKEEMHHPFKHIIMKAKKPIMVDFERCHTTNKPKNTTQFCQYIMSSKLAPLLKKRGFNINRKEIIKLARHYKQKQAKKRLNLILKAVN